MWNQKKFFEEIKKIAEKAKIDQQKKNRKLVKKSEIYIDGRILGPAFWFWRWYDAPFC